MKRRDAGALAAAVVGVVALLVLFGRPDRDGPPLDPSSSGPLGTKALVLLLEDLGADVDVTSDAPGPSVDVALVLVDGLDDARRDDVQRWVAGGGTLVVTDPESPLNPFEPAGVVPGDVTGTAPLAGGCPGVPALRDVERLDPSGGVVYAADRGCFGGFVAVTDQGAGTVAAIGGPAAFVNTVIGREDNAVLAASLLAPREETRVAILRPPVLEDGGDTLGDLVPDGVRGALAQLAVAFLLYALWRARRLGRPVAEPQPVELPASELVLAVGHLLQQAGRAEEAGRLLGDDLRRALADRLGLGPDAPPGQVADVAAARTGIPAARVLAALAPSRLGSDADLVSLAGEADTIRQEVTHGNR